MPLMDVVHDMGSGVLVIRQKDLDIRIVSNGKLKELQEGGCQGCKIGVDSMCLNNVPLSCDASKGPMEETKPN